MLGRESILEMEEARGSYESFDCAQAVALIGFIGLLSNFQDIIEEFTTLINGRKKRSNSEPLLLPLNIPFGNLHWNNLLDSLMTVAQWEEESKMEEKDAKSTWNEQNEENGDGRMKSKKNEKLEDEEDMQWLDIRDDYKEGDDNDQVASAHPSLLSHLARIGTKMAMWVVDTSDGRVTGEEGRAGICRGYKTLSEHHGWLGTLSSNLLLRTLNNAMSHHQPSRTRLALAGLSQGALTC